MKKPLILLFAAVLAVSCQESMKQLTDRVFEVAEYQFTEMDKTLTDTNVPKSTRFGVLVPSETKSWTSGFYPGSLWYVYMYTGNENTKALAEKNTEKLYIEMYFQVFVNYVVPFSFCCIFWDNYMMIIGP